MSKRVAPNSLSLCLLLLIFLALPQKSWGQAVVNESLETAFVYVDAIHGSDTNGNGTSGNPWQTINKAVTAAVTNNQAGIGTQVNIQPGTYRESVNMKYSSKDTSLPITFQAVTKGTVIINGATVMTGWTVYSGNSNIYLDNWTYNFGTCAQVSGCPEAQDITLHTEMLIVNGKVMTQVLSIAELEAGSFYVDQAGGKVYLYPPSGTKMSTATVETATQPFLWKLGEKSNIVLRGLTFQYANSCLSSAAVEIGGTTSASNILLDTLTIQWNNGQGLSFSNPASNFTVQNTIANHNGAAGFQEFQTLNGLWTNDTANFNNWRGAQGGYYACNTAGSHPFQAHADTINGMTLAYNQSYGIHWDTDNANISVSNLVSTNNLIGALFSEKNEGPISISASHLCNGNPLNLSGGLAIRNSTDVSFTNGTIVNNPMAQIDIFGDAGGDQITNWQTGQTINLVSSNFTSTGNIIQGNDTTQGVFDDTLGGDDWTTFVNSFVSNQNIWWNSSNSSTPFAVPTPALNSLMDFSGWQSTTGQDLLSTWAASKSDPAAACNAIVPDMPDYWLNIDNTALTLNPLGQATFNLTSTPLNFSGTLSLLADGLQSITGMSSSFSPSTIALSGGVAATSALTITGSTKAPAGTYPVTIVANNGNLTHMVTAQVTVPPLGFRLSSMLLAFGNQQTNTTSASQTVTLTNNAKTSTSITSIVSSLTVFTQTNTCGTKLAAGKSCTVTVTFTPDFPGTFNGSLTFTDADATSPQVVTLTGTGTAPPTANLLPSSLKFGTVTVGVTSSASTATLTNTSLTAALNITSITLAGTNPGDFKITSASTCPQSGTVNPLATCLVSVTFTPSASGVRTATLTINDNTNTGNETINLSGTGKAAVPTATLLPKSLNFGSVTQGKTSGALTSTLTDTSSAASLNITSMSLTGANPGDFKITSASTCPQSGTINPLATCLVSVTFTPSATGSRSATLTINDNTHAGTQAINLSGSGKAAVPTATLLPKSLNFGSITQGKTSAALTSTLTDTSSIASLNITSMTLTGANPGDFKITSASTCPQSGTLNPLATCLISVTFTPSATGLRSATLTVNDNTSSGTQTIALDGTGTSPYPTATLLPASLNFGSITVGKTSAAQSSTLTDTSATIAVSITSMTLSGANPANFKITSASTCPSHGTVSPLKSCLVTVTFTPSKTGSRSATLTVNDNTSGGTQTISLSGTGQ